MQKDHDFPHGLLFGPGGENAARANRPISAGEWDLRYFKSTRK
jgi:hypothetical protein